MSSENEENRHPLLSTVSEKSENLKRKQFYQREGHLGRGPDKDSEMGQLLSLRWKRSRLSDDSSASPTLCRKRVGPQHFLSPARMFKVFKFAIEEWVFLALLGLIMAIFSLVMDVLISKLQEGHMSFYRHFRSDPIWLVSFVVWTLYTVTLTCASALCAHYIAPQAIGSGIPEMKTILRGIILKEYLSVRTLISKMIGLTLSLGSGLPIGKEGPFVHIASVVANQLSRFLPISTGVFENESRASEMLAAGCAVGVACTFSAPVGGVLFSIEVTAAYFAVRNYWRGFFAATCSATLFSILQGLRRGAGSKPSAWTDLLSVSMSAHYQTTFSLTDTFTSSELLAFAAMGLVCGIFGAIFIVLHRTVVLFIRRNKLMKFLLQKYWLLYPALLSFIMSAITFPLGAGQYLGGEQTFSHTLNDFFDACSWLSDVPGDCTRMVNASWTGPNGDINIFHSLIAFQITFFILAIIASTLPVPSGIFMPVFVLGGAFGRLVGELLRLWYPTVIAQSGATDRIHPGIYAVVGAAAFCGAVTHTVSVAVIVFELTGQLVLLIPVMIAVLVANAVCSYLQPSIYDSIIKIKRLPYLPDISQSSSMYHSLRAEQFMTTPVAYVGKDSTYAELQEVVLQMSHVRAFPLVENKESMALLGSVSRSQLFKLTQSKLGVKARQAEAALRIKRVIADVSQRYRVLNDPRVASKKDSDTPDPSAEKRPLNRFTVESVDVGNGIVKPKESTYSGSAAYTSVLNQSYLQPPTDIHKSVILAMGSKRTRVEEDDETQKSDGHHTIGDIFRSLTRKGIGWNKKERETEFDLHGEEREQWERTVLQQKIDLTKVHVDPSPFQLVESTSLFKVHSLFSLLGLKRAYVTKAGRLVGVISLSNLRSAIEHVQSGVVPEHGEAMSTERSSDTDSDIDYLHPQLVVLTRPNTFTDLSEANGLEAAPSRRASDSMLKPSSLKISKSDPCLRRQRTDFSFRNTHYAPAQEPSKGRSTTDPSLFSCTPLESERSVSHRRLPQVRIIIPDEDRTSSTSK